MGASAVVDVSRLFVGDVWSTAGLLVAMVVLVVSVVVFVRFVI